ncbi:MAG TPA: GNAT family N-acetyltransferase [Pirellulaceae bacterium]|nr:GNAT family N-acetyltransferase [Pirellulaceae bacterium]
MPIDWTATTATIRKQTTGHPFALNHLSHDLYFRVLTLLPQRRGDRRRLLCEQRFLRDVHRVAVDRHAASINLLTLNDEPIAFSYDYVFQNGAYGLRTGFDPAFAQAGPGAVLLARSLRDGCQHGDRTFDLGETPSAYKTKWRTRTSTSSRFCHYPRLAWRAQALRWKRQLFDPEPAIADPPAGQPG